MKTVSIRDAKNRLLQLAREVEQGETIVVTRNGRPVFELVPHQPSKGLRLEAIDEFKRKHGIETIRGARAALPPPGSSSMKSCSPPSSPLR